MTYLSIQESVYGRINLKGQYTKDKNVYTTDYEEFIEIKACFQT